MANSFGRQVVIPLTNKSGGGVIAGDVVIVDTANNDAFTTTTTAGFTGGVGIAQETIANNAIGRVLVGGYAALVNVNASVTRGNFGKTHTVAKQAADAGASRSAGTFCQFLTGGTTPDALVYPVDLLGSSLTNPMTTSQDIIVGGASGTPARLAIGANGLFLGAVAGALAYAYPAQSVLTADLASQQTLVAGTVADVTGCSVSCVAGTWLLLARCIFQAAASGSGYADLMIADGANNPLVGSRTYVGGVGADQFRNAATMLVVVPGSTTTYKLRAQAANAARIEVSDNILAGAAATGIIAVRLA